MQRMIATGLLTVLLIATSSAFSAGGLSIADCSALTLKTVKARIFKSEGKLRPLIFSRDILHLTACEGLGSRSAAHRIEQSLKTKYDLENRRISIAENSKNPLAPAASDACDGGSPCTAEIYRRKGYPVGQVIPFAKSGGLPFGRFLGHVGAAGHYEITGRGAKAYAAIAGKQWTWTTQSLEVLKDAARDPDFYEWLNPAAHAQTRNDDSSGKINQDSDKAKTAFEAWTRGWLRASETACKEGRTRDAIYLLGYSLHGIQDLVFHEGITNAEHSFRDFAENLQIDAGDHYDEKMELAVMATVQTLSAFRARLSSSSPSCWNRMVGFKGDSYLYPAEKEAALKIKEKDFGVTAYFEYRRLSATVRDAIDLPALAPATDFFVLEHWLKNRQHSLLSQTISQIFSSWGQ